MANYKEKLDSKWLKANVNVSDGDKVRIIDDRENEEGAVVIQVGIVSGGEMVKQKEFQLNQTNLKMITDAYGFESEKWKGKEFLVNVYKARNPKTNSLVDAILLSLPNMAPETNVTDF